MITFTQTHPSATENIATTVLASEDKSAMQVSDNTENNTIIKTNTIMYTTREIKEIESKILYDVVHSMPYVDRKYFITKIIEKCDVPRRHFYNWQDGYARIPTFAKKVIELIVGRPLFEATQGM